MSKQCLDVQQMQHLQELGLKLKPSLIHYYKIINIDSGKWYLSVTTGDISEDSPTYQYIPAYTLQDVLDALPTTILHDKQIYELDINMCNERIEYVKTSVDDVLVGLCFTQLLLIDAAYSMLCWAIENKFVETNKNE
jgi:hypothetical protein